MPQKYTPLDFFVECVSVSVTFIVAHLGYIQATKIK